MSNPVGKSVSTVQLIFFNKYGFSYNLLAKEIYIQIPPLSREIKTYRK